MLGRLIHHCSVLLSLAQADCQRNRQDWLLVAAQILLKKTRSFSVLLSQVLECLEPLLRLVFRLTALAHVLQVIICNLQDVVKVRLRAPQWCERLDMPEIMLDSLSKEPGGKVLLSEYEIAVHCLVFFLEGLETTGSAMTFASYLLAKYPDVQERVYVQLPKLKLDQHLNYDQAQDLVELDKFISETLRLYPLGILSVTRECAKDCTIMGHRFPAGSVVVAAVWQVHHDPRVWPNPDLFDAERFVSPGSPGLETGAYMPFGIGPRTCIGKRFALLGMKIALARLLSQYRLTFGVRGSDPPIIQVPRKITVPANGMFLKLESRNCLKSP